MDDEDGLTRHRKEKKKDNASSRRGSSQVDSNGARSQRGLSFSLEKLINTLAQAQEACRKMGMASGSTSTFHAAIGSELS